MNINKDHLHRKLHHIIFATTSPAFYAVNEHITDTVLRNKVISHLKTRGNSQRNRAVDEAEFYANRDDLIKFIAGILKWVSEMSFKEVYSAFTGRVQNSEELLKNLREEMNKRVDENVKLLQEEI